MQQHTDHLAGRRRLTRRTTAVLGTTALTLALAAATVPAADATTATPTAPASRMIPAHLSAAAAQVGANPTVAGRVAAIDSVTTTLPAVTTAYGVPDLWNQGITGAGTTVAVVDSFGDPDAAQVLDSYSTEHGLPPADLSVIAPAGPIPFCTPELEQQIGCADWIGETDLDITMIHAIAPEAHIVIAATPVNETQGFTGLHEMMTAIDYMAKHHVADVISLSFGTSEDDFPTLGSPKQLDYAFRDAKSAGIPIVAATGDCGSTGNTSTSASQCGDVFPYRVASWPGSDPLVTAVGGSVLHLDADNQQSSPATLWPDSGGGLSKTYARPAWQNGVASITNSGQRSLPDIAMEGIEGTSQATPLFGAVLALATQLHHGPLGFVNTALYQLGPKGAKAGIADITEGDNGQYGVPGFAATKGFDIASGWGTVDPKTFVPALVNQIDRQ
ncbi:MAG TPA: S53 family peptidase [Pseudonocardiaceae bacterium]|nr:S53 family peptidase [Pseudonocardiaceae bacterium]